MIIHGSRYVNDSNCAQETMIVDFLAVNRELMVYCMIVITVCIYLCMHLLKKIVYFHRSAAASSALPP